MSRGYAAKDAKPIPAKVMAGLLVLSAVVMILSYGAYDAGVAPIATQRPAIVEVSLATVIVIVIASMTPTSTLAAWALTATAAPSSTRAPYVPSWTPTPNFAGRETTGRMSER